MIRRSHHRAAALGLLLALSMQACSSVPRRLAAPQVDLLALTALESTADGQLFEMRVQIINPNPADLPVRRFEFDVRLGGEGRLIGEHPSAFTLPGYGVEVLEIEVFTGIVSSVSRLMTFAQGPENNLNYEFHGELILDAGLREPLPVFQRGQVPLSVTLQIQ